jgi:mono/diheme cytochrome c family protein
VQPFEFKDEIDFRDLLKKPQKLFGYSFFYFLAGVLGLGMLYLGNINAVGRNAIAPAALRDSSAFVTDIPFQTPAVLPPVDVLKAGMASDSLVNRGRDVFRANCTSCHGETGAGDGPTAATLNPKPRNFHSLTGWTNGSKVSQIYRTLQEGIVRNGMASYAYLPPSDRFALAHYVRTFTGGHPLDSKEDLLALESTYQLSRGASIAGQIPLQKAAEIIMGEESGGVAEVRKLSEIASTDADPGAEVLRRVASNLHTVFASLHARRGGVPGFDDFVRAVTADPAAAGFKPAVGRLGDSEWSILYGYLSRMSQQLSPNG